MTATVNHNERELAHWKSWQDKADEIWGWQTPAGLARAERRAKLFRSVGRMTRKSAVLEVGCGTGEFTSRIAPHVQQLCGTDLSPELLQRAKSRLHSSKLTPNASFAVQDVTNLELPTENFDTVFGCSVLHHVEVSLALKEMFRVLKPYGWCVFSEPNMLNPQIALQKNIAFIKRHVGDTPDETAFFSWTLRRAFQQAGFVKVTVQHFDFLHPLTPAAWLKMVERIGSFLEKCPGLRALSGSLLVSAQKPGGALPAHAR